MDFGTADCDGSLLSEFLQYEIFLIASNNLVKIVSSESHATCHMLRFDDATWYQMYEMPFYPRKFSGVIFKYIFIPLLRY